MCLFILCALLLHFMFIDFATLTHMEQQQQQLQQQYLGSVAIHG